MKRKIVLLLAARLLFSTVLFAQTPWKNWNTAQLNLSLTRKMDLRISHLRAFDLANGFQKDFNQSSLHLGYELTRKWSISAGYVLGGNNTLSDGSSRVTARVGYKMKLAKVLNWSNSIQGELHAAAETRYRNRVVWNTRLAPRKRLDFLNLMPSASYSLFYNIGGNSIQYYDQKTGAPTVRKSPDGFHRGRLMLNLNSKITKQLSVSLYYMGQREFNLFTPEDRKMNIVKPATGRIVRAFDDFNVAGLTLTYDINLYHSNKK
ncbi:MAG: DUF2490 domain-containing protein [Sphingobacteriales bacterium]|nr:DUF2490 domain-containing protein [Sphingobacteriales bacterium]